MEPISSFQNIFTQQKKYIYCPSGNCPNIPVINYSNNPLKTEFRYICECMQLGKKMNFNLIDFLEKSSYLYCSKCEKKIQETDVNYCADCKVFLDNICAQYHRKYSHDIQKNKNIFNFCYAHKNNYMFRCIKCNKSLCAKCNLNDHFYHEMKQLSIFPYNQIDIDIIISIFEKQKLLFNKIKSINNDIIQSLENDIQIKERIINNYILNNNNYNCYLNLKNLCIYNNEKYEKIIDNILVNDDKIQSNEKNNYSNYINNYLTILYYSLMINKEETINNSLLKELSNKINNTISLNDNDNKIIGIEKKLFEEKAINNNDIIDTTKNPTSFHKDSNKLFSKTHNINYNLSQINQLSNIKGNLNNKIYAQSDFKNDIFSKENIIKNNNMNITENITLGNNYSNLSNNYNKNLINPINYIPNISSEKNINNELSKKKEYSKQEKAIKNTIKIEENYNNSESQEDNIKNENDNINEIKKINDSINNVIILKSGNIAVSKKEVIEIYDLRKLNYSGPNNIFDNNVIKKNCFLQKININKGRYISYVFELFDQTLLCATSSKIFRIKLTNNDLNYEVLGYIKIKNEYPRKIISLGKEFIAVLTEKEKYCYIKLFKIKEKNNNKIINSLEKETYNEKKE